MHQSTHRAVAYGNKEILCRHRRRCQYSINRIDNADVMQWQREKISLVSGTRAMHARWLAQQQIERHIDRILAKQAVFNRQLQLLRGMTHNRHRASFTTADRLETLQPAMVDRHHVALLRLIAPDLHWRHTRLVNQYLSKIKLAAAPCIMHQLRQCVRQTTSADIMH